MVNRKCDRIPCKRFTHVDPFEDTESVARYTRGGARKRFTHVDPFEDTESCLSQYFELRTDKVSPTSIRSRILKVPVDSVADAREIVSPTSIRSERLKAV